MSPHFAWRAEPLASSPKDWSSGNNDDSQDVSIICGVKRDAQSWKAARGVSGHGTQIPIYGQAGGIPS